MTSPGPAKRKKVRPARPDDSGAELLRRCVLGLITALVVARPLVAGEDPGKLLPGASAADLTLTLLWLVAAFGGAAWWAWAQPRQWHGSRVEAALAGVVALVLASTALAASYQRPAWLISWEWLALLLAVLLVRQLAREPGENRRLLTAILATGVTLVGFGLYQWLVDLPRLQAQYAASPTAFRASRALPDLLPPPDTGRCLPERQAPLLLAPVALAPSLADIPWAGLVLAAPPAGPPSSPQVEELIRQVEAGQVAATFARPASYAAYLLLLAPLLAGAATAAWRGRRLALAAVLAVVVVLCGVNLALTQSWPFDFRDWPAGAGPATEHMIQDQPLLGVGPGNFDRHFPRYLPSAAVPKLPEAPGLFLEMAATCGVPALLLLLVALATYFWRTWRVPAVEEPDEDADPRVRWEFYVGGVVGLLLAFVLRASQAPGGEVLWEGAAAAGRSLVWFVAFGALEDLRWPGRLRNGAIALGVAALVLTLSVQRGIMYPTLAQPLWVLVALGLNGLDLRPQLVPTRWWLAHVLPVPVLAGATITYVIHAYYPLAYANAALARAQQNYPIWRDRIEPTWRYRMDNEVFPQAKTALTRKAEQALKERMLQPLTEAAGADRSNSRLWAILAGWYGQHWNLMPYESELGRRAVSSAVVARELDPYNPEGWWAEYRLRLQFAERTTNSMEKREQIELAQKVLLKLVDNDPKDPRLRYLAAETFYRGQSEQLGREQAQEAQALDQQATDPARQLTPEQRAQVQHWLSSPQTGRRP